MKTAENLLRLLGVKSYTQRHIQIINDFLKSGEEEYRSNLWTSPCICPNDEKTGETLCCNHCGKPTARTTSKELPRDEDIYDAGMKIQDIETDEELTGFIVGCHYINSIASPLLASRDARIRELEDGVKSFRRNSI